VCAVGVRVPQEVGKGHGWERVVVRIGGLEEFHHCRWWWRGICVCLVNSANVGDRVFVWGEVVRWCGRDRNQRALFARLDIPQIDALPLWAKIWGKGQLLENGPETFYFYYFEPLWSLWRGFKISCAMVSLKPAVILFRYHICKGHKLINHCMQTIKGENGNSPFFKFWSMKCYSFKYSYQHAQRLQPRSRYEANKILQKPFLTAHLTHLPILSVR